MSSGDRLTDFQAQHVATADNAVFELLARFLLP